MYVVIKSYFTTKIETVFARENDVDIFIQIHTK